MANELLVYPFTFGDRTMSDLLGGKGANLSEMTRMGLPVPPGFTITTNACRQFLKNGTIPDSLDAEIQSALGNLEKELGKKFGDPENPLLVSVRSGAKFSMPGMMETVLNEFHNGHIALNTNLNTSNRLIPSGQDMFVQKQNNKYYITDLRKGFGAEIAGLKIGDEILFFNGKTH